MHDHGSCATVTDKGKKQSVREQGNNPEKILSSGADRNTVKEPEGRTYRYVKGEGRPNRVAKGGKTDALYH